MMRITGSCIRQILLLLFIASLSAELSASQDAIIETNNARGEDAGRRIYRDGELPNGKPLTAIVAGDVAISGTQFSCQSCHGRSGMGAAEGKIIVPAIAGPVLYAPSPQPRRPAYNVNSLMRALREGIDPNGRKLNALMPRFKLSNNEIKALATYLEGLSAGTSPGVDEKVIRFATVVSDAEDPDMIDAVLRVLRVYVDEKNRQTRLEGQRPDRGTSPASRLPTVYRKWVLDVWTVKGPSESWHEQLEKYYQTAPVFALLGGVATDNWEPMGNFCEQHEIPCLFPSTNLPNSEASNFYSVYFSEGLVLEAKLIAHHMKSRHIKSVIQVYCGAASKRTADVLSALLKSQSVSVQDVTFDCHDTVLTERLAKRIAATRDAAIILWLRESQISALATVLPSQRVYMLSTLLNEKGKLLLPSLPVTAYLAYPFYLPGKVDSAFIRFKVWASSRNIDVRYPRMQSEAFFACLSVNDAVSHLDRFLIRDYVLDMLDHAQPMTAYMPIHPRPTIGPGQRFLTKGGYVLTTQNGNMTTRDAAWILP